MKRTLTTITAALALLLTLSLTLAACGGDEPTERPATERSTRTSASETPTTEPEAETAKPTETATKAETAAPTAEALRQRTPRPEATESPASRNDSGTKEAEQATADEQPTATPTDVPPTEEAEDEGLEWPWIDERITFETPIWTPSWRGLSQRERLEHLEDTLIAVTSHTHALFFTGDSGWSQDCNPSTTMAAIARSLALVSPTGELLHLQGAQNVVVDWRAYDAIPWQDRILASDITWESSKEEVLTFDEANWFDLDGWWPTCHQHGETTITATYVNGSTASVKLEVTKGGYTDITPQGRLQALHETCDKEKPVEERRRDQVIAELEPWPWSLAAQQRVKLIADSTGTTYRRTFRPSLDRPETDEEREEWGRNFDTRIYRTFVVSSCLEEEEFEALLEEFKEHPLVKDAWSPEGARDHNRP